MLGPSFTNTRYFLPDSRKNIHPQLAFRHLDESDEKPIKSLSYFRLTDLGRIGINR